MADSTRQTVISRAIKWLGCAISLAAVMAIALAPAPARADGDPASDVIAAQPLFLPRDATGASQLSRGLGTVLSTDPARSPLRVAVIASPADLGAVTALWRRPQSYARFLGQEISLLYRGEVLVVMPGGFGLALDGRAPPAADAALLARLPVPSRDLVVAAVSASVRLRQAHGVLSPGVAIGGAPSAGGGSALQWAVLGAGVLLIVAAWGFSLRARPPVRPRRSAA